MQRVLFQLAILIFTLGGIGEVYATTTELVEEAGWVKAGLELRYSLEHSASNIEREFKCVDDQGRCPNGPEVVTTIERKASRSRHKVWLDGRFGSDTFQLQLSAPYVMQDVRKVTFADGVSILNTKLVESVGSETIELLNQANAPSRRGIGDLTVGLHASLLSMEKREASPDLKARLQYTLPSAPVMRATNLAVGEGLHQILIGLEAGYGTTVRAHMDFSGKLRLVADDELYVVGYRTQQLQHPGAQFRAASTFSYKAWSASDSRSLVLSFGGDLQFTGAGREATVLFDALAGSRCSMVPECTATDYFVPSNAGLGTRGDSSNGVTDVQENLRMGGKLELRYRPSKNFEINAGANLAFTPAYFLTFARIGKDVDNNGMLEDVDQIYQQSEYNPVYVEALDKGGSRLIASGTIEFAGFISAGYRY